MVDLARNIVICGGVRWRKPFVNVLFYLCPWAAEVQRRFSFYNGGDIGRRSQTFYFFHIGFHFLHIDRHLLHNRVGFIST